MLLDICSCRYIFILYFYIIYRVLFLVCCLFLFRGVDKEDDVDDVESSKGAAYIAKDILNKN